MSIFDNAKEAREFLRQPAPITSKDGKKRLIKDLTASMLKSFLEKADRIPEHWDGKEIRTWMAEGWQRESYDRDLKSNTKRGKTFRSDIYNNNL